MIKPDVYGYGKLCVDAYVEHKYVTHWQNMKIEMIE